MRPEIVKILAIPRSDGGVSIMRLYRDDPGVQERAIANYAAVNPDLVLLAPVEIAEGDIPKDRMFRDAYTLVNGKIEIDHDLTKARAIAKMILANDEKPARDREINAAMDIAALKDLIS